MLQLLPALPPEETPATDPPTPPAAAPRLVSLPYWTGWCLGLAPGRVTIDPAPAPANAEEDPSDPKPFRRKCLYCRKFFTNPDTWIQHGYQDCRAKVLPMVILWDFVNASAPKRRRKCSPFQRARSRNFSKSIKRREEKAAEAAAQGVLARVRLPIYERNPNLPLTRGECKDGPRPCPLVSCRAHQAFTVNEENGSVKDNFPFLRIWSDPEGAGLHALEALHGTCGLDLADRAMARTRSTWADDAPGTAGLVALAHLAKSGKPIGNTTAFTLEEVASVLGLSIERVRQLGASALRDVRVALKRMENAAPGVRRK